MNSFMQTGNRGEDAAEALRAEYGAILAARILEAEATDFLWESRRRERYLGQHFDVCIGLEEVEIELARMAVLSFLDGQWHVAAILVDGDGEAIDLLWKRSFELCEEAERAFERAA